MRQWQLDYYEPRPTGPTRPGANERFLILGEFPRVPMCQTISSQIRCLARNFSVKLVQPLLLVSMLTGPGNPFFGLENNFRILLIDQSIPTRIGSAANGLG